MREQATPSEALLWSRLRCRQLGVQFRQQVVVEERFIVDFVAPSVRVIVEVDGGYHARRRGADARRQRALEAAGYRVLRFEAVQVVEQLPVVVAAIRAAVGGG
jgi:very-short-patch-repair endonuclease